MMVLLAQKPQIYAVFENAVFKAAIRGSESAGIVCMTA